ncbi:MAG: methyltransferase domain-containing protein [Pseudomonadota bacterium]
MTQRTNRVRDEDAVVSFASPPPVMSRSEATRIVSDAFAIWQAKTVEEASKIADVLEKEFPDHATPDGFWDSASSQAFRDFFVWGHDHDFGQGVTRKGAMSTRHLEIAAEAIEHGMLPASLSGKQVLDVGCWSGGDLLMLVGLGATVTAIEEHPIAARAARCLLELFKCPAEIVKDSLYRERQAWAGQFNYVYCSGVIYHVTDPLLFMRILFAYLKPGGEVFLETKATSGKGSVCTYSGTMEKGWNWYAPNETAFGRWLVDAGFDADSVRVFRRNNGRLLAAARKTENRAMRETAGFSRPGSWLEGMV